MSEERPTIKCAVSETTIEFTDDGLPVRPFVVFPCGHYADAVAVADCPYCCPKCAKNNDPNLFADLRVGKHEHPIAKIGAIVKPTGPAATTASAYFSAFFSFAARKPESARTLVENKTSIEDLVAKGLTAADLAHAGVTLTTWLNAGYTLPQLASEMKCSKETLFSQLKPTVEDIRMVPLIVWFNSFMVTLDEFYPIIQSIEMLTTMQFHADDVCCMLQRSLDKNWKSLMIYGLNKENIKLLKLTPMQWQQKLGLSLEDLTTTLKITKRDITKTIGWAESDVKAAWGADCFKKL